MHRNMKKLKPVESNDYGPIDLDRLVIYTIVELERLGIDLSLENIIVGAFKLFPKKFSLSGYPEFPDATRVEKSLWRSRGKNRQWITGKTRYGYAINEKTRSIARQIADELRISPLNKERKISPKPRRKDAILKEVEDSSAYSKYAGGNRESISEAELCYLLQGTLDSSRVTLRENLLSLKEFANELERKDILNFLSWLESRFMNFLSKK